LNKISVIIPVFNAAPTIGLLLNGLLHQNLFPDEIIVVDNGSFDNTIQIIQDFKNLHPAMKKLSLLAEATKGPAPCRNKGISAATGDILVFTDGDCVPPSNWIMNISEKFKQDPSIFAIAGQILGFNPENVYEKFASIYTLRGADEEKVVRKFTLVEGGFPTANFSLRREVIEKVGGFNNDFLYAEDYELCARIINANFPIHYLPSCLTFHKHRSSLKTMIRQSYVYGYGHGYLIKTLPQAIQILQFPRFTLIQNGSPKIWIRLNTLDKYLMVLFLMSLLYPPFTICAFGYLIFTWWNVRRQGFLYSVKLNWKESIGMVVLLFVKSSVNTLGRFFSGIRHRIILI
jgi:cellulose synthase/poly-beta-1,6-N-acetylglucosamine synthase-like glycosyltransferase